MRISEVCCWHIICFFQMKYELFLNQTALILIYFTGQALSFGHYSRRSGKAKLRSVVSHCDLSEATQQTNGQVSLAENLFFPSSALV